MTYTPHGKHLMGDQWVATDTTFQSDPIGKAPQHFTSAPPHWWMRPLTVQKMRSGAMAIRPPKTVPRF